MLIDDPVRIRSLIRALQDVVIPSIAPQAQLALEQANLVRLHLSLMLTQTDYAYRLQLSELAHFSAMLGELIACLAAPAGSTDLDRARQLLQRAEPIARLQIPDRGELARLTVAVREASDRILQAALDQGDAVGRQAAHIVLDYVGRQIVRERVAVKTAGFDLDAAALPDLKDVT
jgi:hypothetical protein